MKVKKYLGSTMPEVMEKIKSDLGSDAVILNQKEVRNGGFFGWFKKKQIEVVAALDPQPITRRPTRQTNRKETPSLYSEQTNMNKTADDNSIVLKEIKYLKRMMEQQTNNENLTFPPSYQLAYQYLLEQEVEQDLAKDIIDTVIKDHEKSDDSPTSEEIIHHLQLEIEKRITKISLQSTSSQQKIVHFVGPTGVGKTTTLAKIAAHKMLEENKKIAFITMDTYRIAAIDQLKTYARILDVPIEVAYSVEDYHQAVKQFFSYDLVLVDTAGRNFRDEKNISKLNMSNNPNVKTYLVLSLTAKPKDIAEIYDQFSHVPIKEVIFTKIDETTQYGSMLNISLNRDVKISYITNGQDVPDDLFKPSSRQISNYILGGYFDE